MARFFIPRQKGDKGPVINFLDYAGPHIFYFGKNGHRKICKFSKCSEKNLRKQSSKNLVWKIFDSILF
jgi:hypothetical protein